MMTASSSNDFNLIRWFSITATISIAVVSTLAAWALSAFLTDRMINQESELTANFVRSIAAVENTYSYFNQEDDASKAEIQALLAHTKRIPGVLRINVYSADRKMLWSSDATLIGLHFANNRELDQALAANLVIHSGVVDPKNLIKAEHRELTLGTHHFVENYIPIFDDAGQKVVGVVELYKIPTELFATIEAGVRLIWLTAAGTGLVLFMTLFWIVKRAHGIIKAQGERLIESESLAVVGEMGSAVAHGLRNPLASIRSSAELAMGGELPSDARECAQDIVDQVDRLEGWIRELLTYAKPSHANLGPVNINEVLLESLATYSRELARRDIGIRRELATNLPTIRGDAPLLRQMIGSLISNACEATAPGGWIALRSSCNANKQIVIEVADSGSGMSAEKLRQVFKPFYTSKPKGLGLGLPLAKRMVERLGGAIELESAAGKGTTIRLLLQAWN